MKTYPFVVASTNGDLALEIFKFRSVDAVERPRCTIVFLLGSHSTGWRDQTAESTLQRISLVFPLQALGLPVCKDRQTTFEAAAVAAVGDYLDEKGIPPAGGPENSVLTIECFSDQFDTWRERPPASDDTVESYLRSHLYWAWKFGHENWSASISDRVRLNLTISRIDRMVSIYAAIPGRLSLRTMILYLSHPIRILERRTAA